MCDYSKKLIEHILYRSYVNERPVSHMHLNKVWYFSLGYLIYNDLDLALKTYNNSNIREGVWGAVLPYIQDNYSFYKATPVFEEGVKHKSFNFMNHIIDKLIAINTMVLVDIIQEHKAKNEYYTFKEIKEAFKNVKW